MPNWKIVAAVPKAHSRIIWSCKFSHDDKLIASGSRDKSLKIWLPQRPQESIHTFSFEHGVTSIDFYHDFVDGKYVIAVGFDSGDIEIIYLSLTQEKSIQVEKQTKIAEKHTHSLAVKSLHWRPGGADLASCSEDNSLRIFDITL